MTMPNIRKLFALAIVVTLIFELAANMASRQYRSEAQAQTTQCVVADVVEPANLAITVSYIPNPAAFPTEQSVEIQRRLNTGAWTNLPALPASTRSFVDSSLVQGNADNKYEYRARIVNNDGPSPWSEIGCKTIRRQLRPPPTPQLVVS